MGSTAMTMEPQNVAMMPRETAADVLAAQARALVQARYLVALQNRRDFDEVRESLLKECRRPRFGDVARYSLPKGQKKNPTTGQWEDNFVEGFTIRFAEAAIRCMKNIVVETISVYDDPEKRIVRVSVTDIENNLPYSLDVTIQKQVERKKKKSGDNVLRQRQNSYGEVVYIIEATDDELLMKQNALISKAVRTLGLRLVPGDLLDEAQEEIFKTQQDAYRKDPSAAKKRLLDSFSALNIGAAQLKEFLGHSLDVLEEEEVKQLRGIYAAVKSGEARWEDVLAAKAETTPPSADKDTKADHGDRGRILTEKLRKNAAGPQPVTSVPDDAPPSDTSLAIDDLFGELKYDKAMQAALHKQYPDEADLLKRLQEAAAEQ